MTPEEVFQPTGYPKETYVSRKNQSQQQTEKQLQDALSRSSALISIVGPSKSGKSVLTQCVLEGRFIKISGSAIEKPSDLWEEAVKHLQIPVRSEIETSDEIHSGTEHGESISVGFFDFLRGLVNFKRKRSASRGTSSSKEFAGFSSQDLVDIIKKSKKVLIIDDFHYIPANIQHKLTRQIKDVIETFHVIILSIQHRSDDPVRSNRDLAGRIVKIDFGYWDQEDLCQIGKIGFPKTGRIIPDSEIDRLARQSFGSPQLMQLLCLNYSKMIVNDRVEAPFRESDFKVLIKKVLSNLELESVFRKLNTGPSIRGRERNTYSLGDGSSADNYSLLLRALASDPPQTAFSKNELRQRVKAILPIDSTPPSVGQLEQTLDQLRKIAQKMQKEGDNYSQLCLDYHNDQLHILDPYLMFHLKATLGN